VKVAMSPDLAIDLVRSVRTHSPRDAITKGVTREWFAAYTIPRNEQKVVQHLGQIDVESFLPVHKSVKIWRNRKRAVVNEPLFPSYVFVRVDSHERLQVLKTPGVLRIVGNSKGPVPLREPEIEFLRTSLRLERLEQFDDLVLGERVRIARGVMQGLEGKLLRKQDSLRFVLSLELINQHAAVEVDAADLESLTA